MTGSDPTHISFPPSFYFLSYVLSGSGSQRSRFLASVVSVIPLNVTDTYIDAQIERQGGFKVLPREQAGSNRPDTLFTSTGYYLPAMTLPWSC